MLLDGLKVLDFTQAAGGPFGTQLLGDFGADVIKIEPPTGDHFRPLLKGTWAFSLNRNKKSIALDLKTPEGKEIIHRLIKTADVLIESFVPGTMGRLGLDYEKVKKLNPKIIYCSFSGYGQTGPYRRRAGYDVCAQCESGLMAATGEEGRPYVRIGSSLIDYGTGMYACIGILLALLDRQVTGKGQFIDVSLLDTAVSWMNYRITYYSLTGKNPKRMGSAANFTVPYQVFDTADKPMFIGVSTNKFWKDFCKILNLEDLIEDHRFDTNERRLENKDILIPIIQKELKKHKSAELQKKLEEVGIPCAQVLKISEMVKDPHVNAREMVVDMECPGYGKLKTSGIPIRMTRTKGEIKRRAPLLGEHTVEVLKKANYKDEEINVFFKKGIVFQQKLNKFKS